MSSSNEINVVMVPESVYGVTPTGVSYKTLRKIGDSLSGTPNVVVSDEARSDRQSGGQAIVGLAVGGDINYQLSRNAAFDDLIEAAMMSTWSTPPAQDASLPLTIAVSNGVGTLDRVAGDWTVKYSVGQFIQLTTAGNAENEGAVLLVTAVTVGILSFVGPATMVANAATSPTINVLSHVDIGTTRRSFTVEKQFLDISRYIVYKGMRASKFSLSTQVNQIVSGMFGFAGNNHSTDIASITAGQTVLPADTSPLINPTVDMGFLSIDGVVAQYTIESINVDLDNNVQPEEGIGYAAPRDQIPFEASVSYSMVAHLSAASFALLGNKISQAPVSVAYFLRDNNGDGYAVYLPEVQVSFPDPNQGGKNEHVMINITGVARYSDVIGNTMRIAKIGVA